MVLQVMEIMKSVFGAENLDTLTGTSNLASTYWSKISGIRPTSCFPGLEDK